MTRRGLLSAAILSSCAAGCAAAANTPAAGPAPAPALAPTPAPAPAPGRGDVSLRYEVVFGDRVAGHSDLTRRAGGAYDEDFTYDDRGRGPRLHAHAVVGADGIPTAFEVTGTDYLHRAIHEAASCDGARCTWQGDDEHGEGARGFYLASNSGAILDAPLLMAARAAAGGALRLLPAGALRAEKVAETTLERTGEKRHVVAWQMSGVGLWPSIEWFDDDGAAFANVSEWQSLVREGWRDSVPQLRTLERPLGVARREAIAKEIAHRPAILAVVHARLFEPEKRATRDDVTIVVKDGRVTQVGVKLAPPAEAEVIDAHGKTVLPGLWDMHSHTSDNEGLLHIAAGVTTVRDLGNAMAPTLARRARWDAGAELGPRVILAGMIDGHGPFQGPIGSFVDTADEARAAVDEYAANGYVQIKVYSSVKPELVPIMTAEAHKKGLRVSGHVPAHMIAEDAVRAGFDEIQHVNFLMLDLVADRDADTRTPVRFTAVAEHAADVDLDAPKTKALLDLLVSKRTVVDPTLSVFEGMFTIRADHPDPVLTPILTRLPPQLQRDAKLGGLPVPEGKDARYRASFQRCKELVKRLWDRKVTIVAGTDGFPGFALHHELELYSEAGIPNADVLALATLGAARVVKHDRTSGSVAPGKDADLVIVDGDPLAKMSDVRNVVTVIKGGTVIDAGAALAKMAIAPR